MSDIGTVFTFRSLVRPPPTYTLSVTSSPAFAFSSSRWRRRTLELPTLASPASSRLTRRSTPLMDWMRFPSSSPALPAGPASSMPMSSTPNVSRLLPVLPSDTPSAARSSSRLRETRRVVLYRSSAATVFSLTVLSWPPLWIFSSNSSPAFVFANSRESRRVMASDMSQSPTSAAASLSVTPLMEAIRLPSSIPALSAGPPGDTELISTPSVSRALPDEVVMPMTARSPSSDIEKV